MGELAVSGYKQMELDSERALERNRAEAAELAYLSSPEVAELNDKAHIAIFGTNGRTEGFVDDYGNSLQSPIKGQYNEILENRRFGTTESERKEKASNYLSSIESLTDTGLELFQAKFVTGTKQAQAEKQHLITRKLVGQYIANGTDPAKALELATARSEANSRRNLKDELAKGLSQRELTIIDLDASQAISNKSTGTTPAKQPKAQPKKPVQESSNNVIGKVPKTIVPPIVKTAPTPSSSKAPIPATVTKTPERTKKAEKLAFDVATAEQPLHGEDAILRNDAIRLYGVIDGMGGARSGDIAAEKVSKGMDEFWQDLQTPITIENAVDLMKQGLSSAQFKLEEASAKGEGNPRMGAVGTFLKFFTNADGGISAVVGHVGDTQLRVKNPGQPSKLLTQDEGKENVVYNAFSANREPQLDQVFVIPKVDADTRFALYSDGISGDLTSHFLTEEEYDQAMGHLNEQDVADELIALSKKNDDKSVIVIDVRDENFDPATMPTTPPVSRPRPIIPVAPSVVPAPAPNNGVNQPVSGNKAAADNKNTSPASKRSGRIKDVLGKAKAKIHELDLWTKADNGIGRIFRRSGEWKYFKDEQTGKKRRRITEGAIAAVAVATFAILDLHGSNTSAHVLTHPSTTAPANGMSQLNNLEKLLPAQKSNSLLPLQLP